MAVVLDPRTGDVLAMAIRPTFNPNTFLDVPSADYWRNRAVTDPFEPGSTFKVILAAAALEEGVVRPDDRIYGENGAITLAGTTIHDWKKYGWLTFAEVLQNSSNVGSIKVGLALGRERYYRYMTAFGFGALTGVGLAGESRGPCCAMPQRWSLLSLPTMSIGQEISVTALQIVAAFGAIANDGTPDAAPPGALHVRRRRPRDPPLRAQGRCARSISPETARTLTRPDDPGRGGGHRAHRRDPRVRRSAARPARRRSSTRRPGATRARPACCRSSGFAPADDPRFAMLVMLDEPKNEKWGSEAAAPIFIGDRRARSSATSTCRRATPSRWRS